jgi:hypothetical protein
VCYRPSSHPATEVIASLTSSSCSWTRTRAVPPRPVRLLIERTDTEADIGGEEGADLRWVWTLRSVGSSRQPRCAQSRQSRRLRERTAGDQPVCDIVAQRESQEQGAPAVHDRRSASDHSDDPGSKIRAGHGVEDRLLDSLRIADVRGAGPLESPAAHSVCRSIVRPPG